MISASFSKRTVVGATIFILAFIVALNSNGRIEKRIIVDTQVRDGLPASHPVKSTLLSTTANNYQHNFKEGSTYKRSDSSQMRGSYGQTLAGKGLRLSTLDWFNTTSHTIRRKLQSAFLYTACSVMNGVIDDETGLCTICLKDNCFVMGDDIVAVSDNFCTTTAFPLAEETKYCGTATCRQSGLQVKCEASIPILDKVMEGTATCGFDMICSCDSMSWGGEMCTSCAGAAEGYDCTNVGGPYKFYAVPRDPVRGYWGNLFFTLAVWQNTMPQAAVAAGVPIGGAIDWESWPDASDYIPGHYTSFTPENQMKWMFTLADTEVLGIYNFSFADEMVSFAESTGVQIRGHILIWPISENITYPAAVRTQVDASSDPNATLMAIMREHIQGITQHFGEKVAVWDVVNEHLLSRNDDSIFFRTLGDDYVKFAFEAAREFAPSAALVWNEVFEDFSLSNPSIQLFLDLLQQYKVEGVPIDRVGIQGHLYNDLHDMVALRSFLKMVTDMDYDIEITEFDAKISAFLVDNVFHDPYGAQADYYANYLRACLDTGRCKGFTTWGMWDGFSWLDHLVFPISAPNRGLMIDDEGFPKPAWLSIRRELESYANQFSFIGWLWDALASIWSFNVVLLGNTWNWIFG